MDKENILYYQSNIKTSRNKDSVYAMKYANQQMLIDKLEQQCKKQKELIDKIKNCFDNGHFEDSCDCLIIEKYIDSYFEEVSE